MHTHIYTLNPVQSQPAGYDRMRRWENGSISCDEKPSINFNPVKAEPHQLAAAAPKHPSFTHSAFMHRSSYCIVLHCAFITLRWNRSACFCVLYWSVTEDHTSDLVSSRSCFVLGWLPFSVWQSSASSISCLIAVWKGSGINFGQRVLPRYAEREKISI